MKISFIGQKGIPATWGGIEYHVDHLSRGLSARGHEVTVYVRSWYTDKNKNRHAGVRLRHVPTLKTKHLDASIHSLLCSMHAIFNGADIIHYHAIGPSLFSILPSLFKKRIVCTVHRLDWQSDKWGRIAKVLLKIGEYTCARIPHRTIVVSKELQRYFKETYGKETIHIPNGIDEPRLRNANIIKKKYGLEGNDYILFMGRLVPEKRVDWLIHSYRQIKKTSARFDHIRLVLAGGSSATDAYIRQLMHLSKKDPGIIFTDYVTGAEKEELLTNASVFILPSRLEGFPIVLLEALSYGLGILSSDIPPHREAIQDGVNGFFFEWNKPSDLTHKLRTILDDPPLLGKIKRNALDGMKKRWRWNNITQKTLCVYEEVRRNRRCRLVSEGAREGLRD